MAVDVGIVAADVQFPAGWQTVTELLEEEGGNLSPAGRQDLGIEAVYLCDQEKGSDLAVAAAQAVLGQTGLKAADIDVIIDYSILPQEYLVPAWNMSNKLQHEIGATKAFTLGFSSGGATNFLVALQAATALIRSNERVNNVMLVAADMTIPGNRLLNPEEPRIVLGDCAAAMLIQQDAHHHHILETVLHTEGGNHDICYIPGGALAHPDRPDLYRLVLDVARYDHLPKMEKLAGLVKQLLVQNGLAIESLAAVHYPFFSTIDRKTFQQALGLTDGQMANVHPGGRGHYQGNDFVRSWLHMAQTRPGDKNFHLFCSHGLGYMYGATLVQA